MKKLRFEDNLIPLILTGKKYTTWRIGAQALSRGDIISLCRNDGREFGKAKILSVKKTIFENLTEEDKAGHEKYSSNEEMYQVYSRYYKMRVNPQSKLKVIKFKLL